MANQRVDIIVRVCVSKNTLTKFGKRKRGLYVKRHAFVIITNIMLLFNIVAIQNACQTKKQKKQKKQNKTIKNKIKQFYIIDIII